MKLWFWVKNRGNIKIVHLKKTIQYENQRKIADKTQKTSQTLIGTYFYWLNIQLFSKIRLGKCWENKKNK